MWLPLLAPSVHHLRAGNQIKGHYFGQNSMCLLAFLDRLHLPLSWSAPDLCWVASLLPILDEKSHWCIWFHKWPLRGWIMQPKSEGECTWLLPSRKQEKGKSQINSPSFLPSCIPSRRVLFAKPTSLLCSSRHVRLGQRANASCCVDVHVSLPHKPFTFTPTTWVCSLILVSGSTF